MKKYASGLRVQKLICIVRDEYGIDLMELSQDHGYKDILEVLQSAPQIKLLNPEKGNNCLVQFQKGNDCLQRSLASQLPTNPQYLGVLSAQPNTQALAFPVPNPTHLARSMDGSNQQCASISSKCKHVKAFQDPILKEEVLVTLLLHPQGVTFEEFPAVFCHTHGYHMSPSLHVFSTFLRLIDNMKDLVEMQGDPQNPTILCRTHHHFAFFDVEYR